jgi:hypothetical protein
MVDNSLFFAAHKTGLPHSWCVDGGSGKRGMEITIPIAGERIKSDMMNSNKEYPKESTFVR